MLKFTRRHAYSSGRQNAFQTKSYNKLHEYVDTFNRSFSSVLIYKIMYQNANEYLNMRVLRNKKTGKKCIY